MFSFTKLQVRCFSATKTNRLTQIARITPEEENALKVCNLNLLSLHFIHIGCFRANNIRQILRYFRSRSGSVHLPSREYVILMPLSIPILALFQPARFLPGLKDTMYWMLFRRNISTERLRDMTTERVNNTDLMDRFGLSSTNFNHRVYWLTVHSWILHQRFLVEKLSKLESDYVDRIWLLPYKWMLDKGVPRHRLQVELEHAHKYSLKFSVDLDGAITRPEILPGQICEVVWRTIYSEDPKVRSASDHRVINLTKYIIRNLNFVLNCVPTDNFTQGAFAWPGMYSSPI